MDVIRRGGLIQKLLIVIYAIMSIDYLRISLCLPVALDMIFKILRIVFSSVGILRISCQERAVEIYYSYPFTKVVPYIRILDIYLWGDIKDCSWWTSIFKHVLVASRPMRQSFGIGSGYREERCV